MNNEKTVFDKIIFTMNCIFAVFWCVFSLINLWKGFDTHETYYLVLAIIEYWFMQGDLKDIKKYLDIKD